MTTSNNKITLNEFTSPSGKVWRVLRIARALVERCDVGPVVNTLRDCVATKTEALSSFQSLVLSMEGYDDDPRELHEVPEVRAFFATLASQVPWWVHLPTRDFGSITVWVFCLTSHRSPMTKEGDRISVELDSQDMTRHIAKSVTAAAMLYHELGYTEAEAEKAITILGETFAEAGKLANTGKPVWHGELTMDPETGETRTKPVATGATGTLLDLAVASTGRPVDVDLVQFTDKKAFGRLTEKLLAQLSQNLADGVYDDIPKMEGFAQEDGSLEVRFKTRIGVWEHMRFEKGEWKQLSDTELQEVHATISAKTDDMTELAEKLGGALHKTAESLKERNRETEPHINQVSQSIMVFTKDPSSLEYLRIAVSKRLAESTAIEKWLQGPDEIFVLSNGRDRNSYWSTVASSTEDLLNRVLPDIAARAVNDMDTTVLMPIGMRDRHEMKRALHAWRAIGGMIPPGAL